MHSLYIYLSIFFRQKHTLFNKEKVVPFSLNITNELHVNTDLLYIL